MTSKKQWALIALITIIGFLSADGGILAHLGVATPYFLVSYGIVLGYNGIDLTDKVLKLISRTD